MNSSDISTAGGEIQTQGACDDRLTLITAYIKAGLALVPIPYGEKGPTAKEWNNRENCITTREQASRLTGNLGLAHAYCNPPTCAVDIDDMEKARAWLAERGIDLNALLTAPDAVRIDSGREGRAKLLYRLDAPLPQKKKKDGGNDIIDFRCASQDGLTVQDVLPPSIHPDTGRPYTLHGDITRIPPIPPALLRVWHELMGGKPPGAGDASGVPARFWELLAGDDDLARRWRGDTEGLNDPSPSGLDMSLTSLLVKRGFNDAEITATHKAYPHGKVVRDGRGEHDSYITSMLAKARADRILPADDPLTCARRMVAERYTNGDGISLWRHWNGDTYEWRGGAYCKLDTDDVNARIQNYLEPARCYSGKGEKTKPFKSTPAKVANVRGTLEMAFHIDSQHTMPCWLDGATGDDPRSQLVVANGMLDLTTRALQTHDPRLFTTTRLPFAYDPNAGQPKELLKFLQSVWGDDNESIETLQEFFGYCLTADCSQQKIFLVVGPKRSGKGTIAKVLRAAIGEANCAGPTLASLSTNFGLQPLIGKRLAIISDARLGNKTDKSALTERLCSISGEDVLNIDRKYTDPWTGALGARLILFTNELPKIVDDSNALSSRFIVLRMVNSFYGKEDLGLADKLLRELPAILNWSLDGLARLRERGRFIQPASAMELVRELDDLASPIGAFVRDRCVVRPGAYVECQQLFTIWTHYCREHGWIGAGTDASFGVALRAVLPQLERKRMGSGDRQRVYLGIALAVGNATVLDLAARKASLL